MVFIFGCSRTGSKAYMHMFSEHLGIHLTRELHLFSSFAKQSFLRKYIEYRYGHRNNARLAHEFPKLKNASYWRSDDYDANAFEKYLDEHKKGRTLRFWELFHTLLSFDRDQHGKETGGAKFPAHVMCYPLIKRKYPKAQYIFLARRPEDILFSQFNKHEMRKTLPRLAMIIHMVVMFNFTLFYARLWSRNKVYFVKYEDFKNDRDATLTGLCRFLGREYKKDMADLPILGSRMKKERDPFYLSGREKALVRILTWPWKRTYEGYKQ